MPRKSTTKIVAGRRRGSRTSPSASAPKEDTLQFRAIRSLSRDIGSLLLRPRIGHKFNNAARLEPPALLPNIDYCAHDPVQGVRYCGDGSLFALSELARTMSRGAM